MNKRLHLINYIQSLDIFKNLLNLDSCIIAL